MWGSGRRALPAAGPRPGTCPALANKIIPIAQKYPELTAPDIIDPLKPMLPEQMAKVLFSYENPPGTEEIAGSQDAIGIVMPGLNRSEYAGEYWPRAITSDGDESRLAWLEARLWLVPLDPRESGYRVLSDTNVSVAGATALANAADACWHGIQSMDAARTGAAMTASYEAQIAMFPHMVARDVPAMIERYRTTALGWKLSGAGGGGYLTLFSEQPITGALRVKIRRRHSGL